MDRVGRHVLLSHVEIPHMVHPSLSHSFRCGILLGCCSI